MTAVCCACPNPDWSIIRRLGADALRLIAASLDAGMSSQQFGTRDSQYNCRLKQSPRPVTPLATGSTGLGTGPDKARAAPGPPQLNRDVIQQCDLFAHPFFRVKGIYVPPRQLPPNSLHVHLPAPASSSGCAAIPPLVFDFHLLARRLSGV